MRRRRKIQLKPIVKLKPQSSCCLCGRPLYNDDALCDECLMMKSVILTSKHKWYEGTLCL